jgi:hypothetical protein
LSGKRAVNTNTNANLENSIPMQNQGRKIYASPDYSLHVKFKYESNTQHYAQ